LRAGSLVFDPPLRTVDLRDWSQWWKFQFGANWRKPYGSGSSIKGLDDYPVVHIGYRDAEAYAAWAIKQLPTEAEWEFAARGGLDNAEFAWGDEFTPGRRHMANIWQGEFPLENTKADGYPRTSPATAFPPNGYGLFDMIGNVGEWTMDFWSTRHPADEAAACCVPRNPRGAGEHELRSLPAANSYPTKSSQGRLASLRSELLPPLSNSSKARRSDRYLNEPCGVPLRGSRKDRVIVAAQAPADRSGIGNAIAAGAPGGLHPWEITIAEMLRRFSKADAVPARRLRRPWVERR
jgi:hypothetical protein